MQSPKRDFGEIACGVLMLILGLGFLWSARSAVLYHTQIYFKGWTSLDPWQAFIGGGLSSVVGLFAVIDGICRKRKRGGDS
jgi:hypothetical protein